MIKVLVFYAVLCVLSSANIISLGKRELVAFFFSLLDHRLLPSLKSLVEMYRLKTHHLLLTWTFVHAYI